MLAETLALMGVEVQAEVQYAEGESTGWPAIHERSVRGTVYFESISQVDEETPITQIHGELSQMTNDEVSLTTSRKRVRQIPGGERSGNVLTRRTVRRRQLTPPRRGPMTLRLAHESACTGNSARNRSHLAIPHVAPIRPAYFPRLSGRE